MHSIVPTLVLSSPRGEIEVALWDYQRSAVSFRLTAGNAELLLKIFSGVSTRSVVR